MNNKKFSLKKNIVEQYSQPINEFKVSIDDLIANSDYEFSNSEILNSNYGDSMYSIYDLIETNIHKTFKNYLYKT